MDVDLPPPSRGGNETRSMELKGWTETSGRKPIEAKGVVPVSFMKTEKVTIRWTILTRSLLSPRLYQIDDELEDIADYENAREVEAQLLGTPFEVSKSIWEIVAFET